LAKVIYWLWLWSVKGVGPATAKNLLTWFREPRAVYEAAAEELCAVPGIGPATAEKLISARSLDRARRLFNDCKENEISILTLDDPRYPDSAKKTKYAPILVFFKGKIPENFYSVAIVGSRRCSQSANETALSAAAFLAENGIAVISGMAKGIDSYAHVACIKNGGYTIAFVGCGLDICYPAEHRELMAAIAGSGAVISEYPPGTPARAEHFPARNRLISSWSDKVLVVEAGEKSGALITADFARQHGREVLVLPGETTAGMGKGTLRLVEEKAAKIFCDPTQLLPDAKWERVFARARAGEPRELRAPRGRGPKGRVSAKSKPMRLNNPVEGLWPEARPIQPAPKSGSKQANPRTGRPATKEIQGFSELSPTEKKILACILQSSKSLECIAFECGIPQGKLLRQLSTMEAEGKIQSLPGARYVARI
jgi:DNA processing protein